MVDGGAGGMKMMFVGKVGTWGRLSVVSGLLVLGSGTAAIAGEGR